MTSVISKPIYGHAFVIDIQYNDIVTMHLKIYVSCLLSCLNSSISVYMSTIATNLVILSIF